MAEQDTKVESPQQAPPPPPPPAPDEHLIGLIEKGGHHNGEKRG
jgi:hypothetical protein